MAGWRARALLGVTLAWWLAGPCGAGAQVVAGTVVDGATARPIAGAFVELLDGAGQRRVGALTDSLGRYRLAAPAPGGYRLRAQMIGFADAAWPLALDSAGGTAAPLRLTVRAIPLAGLTVEARPRCKLQSDTAGVVLAVWAEARKAVALADWSARESGLAVEIERTEGVVGRRDQETLHDTVQGEPPFLTVPLDSVRVRGLVWQREGYRSFYAPGLDYILSDDFIGGHCFAARAKGDRIGLTFVPVEPARPGDVKGTLWLDRGSMALQRLEFEFVKLEGPDLVRSGSGELDFDRTPQGVWLIRSWAVQVTGKRVTWGDDFVYRARGEVRKAWLR